MIGNIYHIHNHYFWCRCIQYYFTSIKACKSNLFLIFMCIFNCFYNFSGCIASLGNFISQLIVPNPATGGKIAWRSVAAYATFG